MANQTIQIFSPRPKEGQSPPKEEEIEARTWEFLILRHEARRGKIAVSDEEVRQKIARMLGEGGQTLSSEQYFQWVRHTLREEPREFENQVREHLRIRKLISQVRQGMKEDPEAGLRRWMTQLFQKAQLRVYRSRP